MPGRTRHRPPRRTAIGLRRAGGGGRRVRSPRSAAPARSACERGSRARRGRTGARFPPARPARQGRWQLPVCRGHPPAGNGLRLDPPRAAGQARPVGVRSGGGRGAGRPGRRGEIQALSRRSGRKLVGCRAGAQGDAPGVRRTARGRKRGCARGARRSAWHGRAQAHAGAGRRRRAACPPRLCADLCRRSRGPCGDRNRQCHRALRWREAGAVDRRAGPRTHPARGSQGDRHRAA